MAINGQIQFKPIKTLSGLPSNLPMGAYNCLIARSRANLALLKKTVSLLLGNPDPFAAWPAAVIKLVEDYNKKLTKDAKSFTAVYKHLKIEALQLPFAILADYKLLIKQRLEFLLDPLVYGDGFNEALQDADKYLRGSMTRDFAVVDFENELKNQPKIVFAPPALPAFKTKPKAVFGQHALPAFKTKPKAVKRKSVAFNLEPKADSEYDDDCVILLSQPGQEESDDDESDDDENPLSAPPRNFAPGNDAGWAKEREDNGDTSPEGSGDDAFLSCDEEDGDDLRERYSGAFSGSKNKEVLQHLLRLGHKRKKRTKPVRSSKKPKKVPEPLPPPTIAGKAAAAAAVAFLEAKQLEVFIPGSTSSHSSQTTLRWV
jgi:hypothetical protein